jgi:hypothetical protein
MRPAEAGWYIFCGDRVLRHNGQHKAMHEPVRVVEVWCRGGYELGVKLCGRQQAFPLREFVGTWRKVEIEGAGDEKF